MPRLILTLVILITGLQSPLAQEATIANKTYAQRLPLLYNFYLKDFRKAQLDSAKAFKRIDSMARIARQAGDDALLTETVFMGLYYRSQQRNSHSSKELIHSLDSLRQVAVHKNYPWLIARIEMCIANYYFDHELNYELGFIQYDKLNAILKQLSAAEFPGIQIYYYNIGNTFYFFNRWERAIAYYQDAINNTPAAFPETDIQLGIYNNAGLAYQKLGRYDSSNYCFNKVISLAQGFNAHTKEVWTGIASGNLGYNSFLQKQYDAAVPLLETDVRIAEKNQSWRLAVGSVVPLAEIALAENRMNDAIILAEKARIYASRAHQFRRWEIVYPLLCKIAAYQGNGPLASMYYDSAILVKDSLASYHKSMQLTRANQRIAFEKHEADMAVLDAERKLKLLERNMLLVGLLALGLLLFYVYRRQKQKVKAKHQELVRTGKELEEASNQLDIFTRHIADKNKLIENLLEQTNGMKEDAIEQLRQSTILTDEDWRNFQALYEKAHPGFFERLRQNMPGLSPAETRFVVLTKLDIAAKEMTAMLGVGPEAIRQYRLRLRKKLQLTEDDSLQALVNDI